MRPRIAVTGVLRRWDGADRTGVNAAYVESVLKAGGVPLILSPILGAEHAAAALEGADGLLLTGGEDIDPALYGETPSPRLGTISRSRDLFELAAFRAARERDMPVLGVCRGIQLVNVALGGTLYQDLPSERPSAVAHEAPTARNAAAHAIRVQPGSRTAIALGQTATAANSFHHQAVRDLAPGLIASGWADDNLVEAVEAETDPWLIAVQWHPEEMHADATSADSRLFAALVAEAQAFAHAPSGRRGP